jgi:hypothetical protein
MRREQGLPPLDTGFVDTRTAEQKAQAAFESGNFGATAGYAAGNDATRAAYDKAHRTTQAVGIGRLPGEVGKYFGNADVNLNPFDGAPQNVRDAAHHNAATDDYANRFQIAATDAGAIENVIGQDQVPTGPGAPAGPPAGGGGAPGGTGAPGTDPASAPTLGREEIDKSLSGLDAYQTALWEMSQDNTGLSAAEAQLKKATDLANVQAGIATESSQRAALGQARSARNRGDRAFLEQQAIGEAGFIGQEASRTAALRQAESEGNLSVLRAGEEDADRRFRLEAIKEAAGLGLNTAALEVDISKADLASLTNQINNDAAFKQLGLQLDQRQAESLLNYSRDMAALQFQYDKMSVDDQNATDALLMQKYGIDQGTMVALKQMKDARRMNWNQFLAGAMTGATQAGATAAFSDRRVKRNVAKVREDELDELLTAIKAETWDYADEMAHGGGRSGRRFGPMAQDLERTRLGKAMVAEDLFGTKKVDTGAVALATASGLAHVYDRLKGLEEAVK